MDSVLTQWTMTDQVTMDVAVARQTIMALTRYGIHTKGTIQSIVDADSAVDACALTLHFVGNVRTFVESIESADICNPEIVRTGSSFLEHAVTQAVTAMSTEHEPDAIKGHLYMALAIAEHLLSSLQSDIVIRT